MRLWAQHERLLEPGGVGDEDVAERQVRADALDIALGRGRVDYSGWPPAVVRELRDDGQVVNDWVGTFKDGRSDEQADYIAELGLVAE